MALTCPNPNMAEWKALEKKYGYAAAMRMYEMNGEVIPSLEQAAGMEINMADGQRVFDVLPDYDMDLTNAESEINETNYFKNTTASFKAVPVDFARKLMDAYLAYRRKTKKPFMFMKNADLADPAMIRRKAIPSSM